MVTLAMIVAYKGAAFSGFAQQPEQHTVQGELEHALATVLRREITTTCAGRTDAGVHARGQVVSFEVTPDVAHTLDFRQLKLSLNAITHNDIAIRNIWRAADGFSARFSAKAREYRYFLAIDEAAPVFMRDFSWHVGSIDSTAMERASRCLIGEQDFKSFCKTASAVGKPTCRNIIEISFSERCLFGENFVEMKIIGSSFLHSMVRSIMGTLVQVGHGKKPESWVAEVLAARNRTVAGECAPAKGLIFWEVSYDRKAADSAS